MTPPVFGHGQLRLYILSLLEEGPKHGYELMQALSDRFGGTYTPSAGTIYPRLAKLEDDGLVTKQSDGRKTVYAITPAGREELERRRGELDGIEDGVTDSVRRLADEVRIGVNAAMKSLKADLAFAARQARDESSAPTGRSVPDDGRGDSTAALRRVDMVLNDFRHQLRVDLRTRSAFAPLPDEVVDDLRERLDRVRADVLKRFD
jgi:DNA-binding PadR family transcriptional regulator